MTDLSPQEREALTRLQEDYYSGRVDGLVRQQGNGSTDMFGDGFFEDFDANFKQQQTFIKRWFLFVALVILTILGGLAALAVILLNHFGVI